MRHPILVLAQTITLLLTGDDSEKIILYAPTHVAADNLSNPLAVIHFGSFIKCAKQKLHPSLLATTKSRLMT